MIHPVLLTAAYVLNTSLANEVTVAGYARPLIVATVVASLLTGAGWVLLRNRWDGALFATAVIVLLVTPVPVAWVWLSLRSALDPELGALAFALVLAGVLGAVAVRLLQLRRRKQPVWRPAPESLNVISAALLLAVIGSNVVGHRDPVDPTPIAPPSGWRSSSVAGPDIVVFMLDGYPRSDVLKRRLGADNTSFLAALHDRGFDVGEANHSNYTITELTFPSMFQMQYLDAIPSIRPYLGTGERENAAMRVAAEAGQAFSIMRAAGYERIIWSSGWDHMTLRGAADRLVDTGEITDLERAVLHRTWLLYLLDAIAPNIFTDSQRDRIVNAFDTLDRIAIESGPAPRFLFVHVPGPHLPLVVRSDGTAADLSASRYEAAGGEGYGMNEAEYAAAWQSEIDYLDRRTLQSIDLLLGSEAGRRAVIIVMSDHGYGFDVRPGDIQARLGNFFAARTPGAPALFADSPTPVNLFRILFNQYLGTTFEILPDRYFLQGDRKLDLTEISNPDQVFDK